MELIGTLIHVRSFSIETFHSLWKRYIPDPVMDSRNYAYDSERVSRQYIANLEKESWYKSFGIFLPDNTPIGIISLKRIDYVQASCELGLFLANDNYKGKGYGSEAISLILRYAFEKLKLRYIYADTMGSNVIMQHLLDKFGFQYLSRDKRFYNMGSRWEDRLNYPCDLKKYRFFD